MGRNLAKATHAHAKSLTGGAPYAPARVWSMATQVGPVGFPRVAGLGVQGGVCWGQESGISQGLRRMGGWAPVVVGWGGGGGP